VRAIGANPELLPKALPLEESENRLGIPYVYGKKHVGDPNACEALSRGLAPSLNRQWGKR
jgi:hypothetical protein